MKNKHQQVVDLSNPNEGQYTSASTSAIKINDNTSKQTSVEWLSNIAYELFEQYLKTQVQNCKDCKFNNLQIMNRPCLGCKVLDPTSSISYFKPEEETK